jgi:hypothetical protein
MRKQKAGHNYKFGPLFFLGWFLYSPQKFLIFAEEEALRKPEVINSKFIM